MKKDIKLTLPSWVVADIDQKSFHISSISCGKPGSTCDSNMKPGYRYTASLSTVLIHFIRNAQFELVVPTSCIHNELHPETRVPAGHLSFDGTCCQTADELPLE